MRPLRTRLVDFGVVYDRRVAKDGECPAHVDSLRRAILDFSCPLPSSSKSNNLQQLIESEEQKDPKHRHPLIRLSTEIKNEATRLRDGAHAENEWAKFFDANFLDRLASCTLPSDTQSRMYVCRFIYFYLWSS